MLDVLVDLATAESRGDAPAVLYDRVLAGAQLALGARVAALLLRDDAGTPPRVCAARDATAAWCAALESAVPWPGPADAPAAPVLVADAAADPAWRALAADRGALAWIPVVHAGQRRGALVLGYDAPRDFDAADVRAAQALASHAALADARVRDAAQLALYRAVFHHAHDGVAITDAAGRYLEQNDAHRALLGYPDAALYGQTAALHLPAATVAELAAEITRAGGCRTEVTARAASGAAIDMELHVYPVPGAADAPAWYVATARDITERRQVERELQGSRDQLAVLLQGVADGIIAQDPQGRLIYANATAARMLGFESTAALIATPPARLFARFEAYDEAGARLPDDHLPGRRPLRGVALPATHLRFRDAGARRDRWASVRTTPVLNERGDAQFAIHIFRDVTEQRRAESALRFLAAAGDVLAASLEYETTLQAVADLAVPQLTDFCVVDLLQPDGALRQVAVAHTDPARAARLRDVRARAPAGTPGAAWGVPAALSDEPELVSELTPAQLAERAPDPAYREQLAALGLRSMLSVPLEVHGQRLGTMTWATAESERRLDATDLELAKVLGRRAALAIDNARLYRGAQEASRLKDEFLATVSHELRTPLNAVLGWSHILASGRLDPARHARAVDAIGRNAQAQARLIEDILDVSRIISGKVGLEVQRLDLGPVVSAALDAVRPAADAKSIRLVATIDPAASAVRGDASRLQQVVWNLVSNAIKFTPAGGRVAVQLAPRDVHVEVTVSDTGQGIRADFLPYVFDRFRQADSSPQRAHGGLGLGLSIVRHLVELHGGAVRAASDGAGRGATFTVLLPRAATDAPATTTPVEGAQPPAVPDLAGLRVLLVDDEPDAREVARAVLETYGAGVTTAGSVREALAVLAGNSVDVLVSDIGMPGEDGYDLMRHATAHATAGGRRVPAIALTAYARPDDARRARAAGYDVHLAKPIEPDALARAIAYAHATGHRLRTP